jgi:serine protease Do
LLAISLALVACKRFGAGSGSDAGALPSGAVPASAPLVTPSPAPIQGPPGATTPQSFADLASAADAAVVFIRTLQEQRGKTGSRRVVGEGLGSAFVYDANGLVLRRSEQRQEARDVDGYLDLAGCAGQERQRALSVAPENYTATIGWYLAARQSMSA